MGALALEGLGQIQHQQAHIVADLVEGPEDDRVPRGVQTRIDRFIEPRQVEAEAAPSARLVLAGAPVLEPEQDGFILGLLCGRWLGRRLDECREVDRLRAEKLALRLLGLCGFAKGLLGRLLHRLGSRLDGRCNLDRRFAGRLLRGGRRRRDRRLLGGGGRCLAAGGRTEQDRKEDRVHGCTVTNDSRSRHASSWASCEDRERGAWTRAILAPQSADQEP